MKQGEIWSVNLAPTVGSEIRKTRPVIIVSDNTVGRLPLKIIVPLTDWKALYVQTPWMVRVEPDERTKLTKTSSADCFQVRSMNDIRSVERIWRMDPESMEKIREGLAAVLAIEL